MAKAAARMIPGHGFIPVRHMDDGMRNIIDTAREAAEKEGFRVIRMGIVFEGISDVRNEVESVVMTHGYWRANQRMFEEAAVVTAQNELGDEEVPERFAGLRPEDPEQDPDAPGLPPDPDV